MKTMGLKQLVIALAAAIVLSVIYVKTQSINIGDSNQVLSTIRLFKQTDTALNQDILKSRDGILLHYDSLVTGSASMENLLDRISKKIMDSHHHSQSDVDQKIAQLRTIITEKKNLLDQFKSQNAILTNSMRYLPTGVNQFITSLTKHKETVFLSKKTNSLLTYVLSYIITADETYRQKIIFQARVIEQQRLSIPVDLRNELDHILAHTRIVTREKPAVDNLVNQLINSPITNSLDALADNYNKHNIELIKQSNIYRLYLYLFSFALLAYIGFIMIQLKNRTVVLNHAVTDLNYQKFALDQHSIVSITDVDGKIIYANDLFTRMTQFSNEELLGQDHRIINSGYHPKSFFNEMWLTISQGLVWHGQFKNRSKHGNEYWVEATIVPFMEPSGKPYQYVSIRTDITEHKALEEALFHEKERAEVALQAIVDGVITTNSQGLINYINPMTEQLTGWTNAGVQNMPLLKVINIIDDDNNKPLEGLIEKCANEKKTVKASGLLLIHRNGNKHFVELAVTPLLDRAEKSIGMALIFHDLTDTHILAKKMTYQASHDALTGLANRVEFERYLNDLLDSTWERGDEHALCYLDLDQFKIVNDTCGHIAGDELLRQLAFVLSDVIRDIDILARLGGDEFGILLRNCPLEKAREIAEKFCAIVKDFRFIWGDKTFEIGVSIGLVPINKKSDNITTLLSAADTACYAAKDNGRNRVHIYQADDIEIQQRYGEMQWVPRLGQALSQDRFRLYCQRISPLTKGHYRNQHFEVLIRMIDEQGKLIMPGAFIPAAERYDLMPAIDRWVITKAFSTYKQALRHNCAKPHDVCAINLSGASLNDDQFLDFLFKQFISHDMPPQLICFEITETVAIANLTKAIGFMNKLKEIGCQFALDDFGSGLSSFAYLKKLPVDYLKIDGNFITDLKDDPVDYAMVESINNIGQLMGIKTIAEYVETTEIEELVRKIGIDFAQGHAIGKPIPMDTYLTNNRLEEEGQLNNG